MYVDFKKEFLEGVWSEQYRDFMLRNFALGSNEHLILAINEKRVVGALFLSFKSEVVYLEELEISMDYRRKKLGTSLINTVLYKFPDYTIELRVDKNNNKAINFYLKFGFETVEINDRTYRLQYFSHSQRRTA